MNDQSQLMNQPPPPSMMMSQPPPQMMSAPPPSSQQMMMNRSYNNKKPWPQQHQQQFSGQNPPPPQQQLGRINNWKGKKGNNDKRKNSSIGGQSSSGGGYNNNNNNNNVLPNLPLGGGLNSTLGYNITNMSLSGGQSVTGGYNVPNLPLNGGGGQSSYKPPTLNELQSQNRMKARKFYPNRKKYNNRFAPYAPRNTTSFIIRAKKSGGIASLVSPCPVTPAVLPTPIFSPSREVLGDTAKEEWGVDGYGSMKGLIRLRSPGNDDEEEEGGGGSSESDVEEHVEVERRLDHDLSRFEMIYPNYSGVEYNNVLENRVGDQDTHIAQLEEENLTLKERLFLMERELGDLRRRMLFLERRHHVMEEVVENGSENESDVPHMGIGGGDEYASRDIVGARDVSMEEYVHDETNLKGNEARDEVRNELVADGVVSEKVEEARNELIMNKENANKTEVVSSEVETKNVNELMQGQVGVEEGEEKNETGVMRNDVENKIENELMQTNADKDEERGTSCAENSDTEAMKNEGETKVQSELMQGQMNTERDQEMGIASTEKSIGVGDSSVPR